jgi:Putative adhesin
MPTFDTPSPVQVLLSLVFGQVRIDASDRAETKVEAYPRDGRDREDVRAAGGLHIDCADGRLRVDVPEPDGSGGAVVLVIAVPTGSSVHGRGTAVDFLGVGELGDCRLSTGLGHITLDRAGSLHLAAALGDITVDRAGGTVEAAADRGDVHLGMVEGGAVVSAQGEGDATVAEVHGAARVHAEKGAVRIGRAHADVEARTTHGDIDVGEVARGSVATATTFGSIRVGVAGASRARLSLDSTAGTVYTALSLLEPPGEGGDAAPGEGGDEVSVQARTVIGDIVVQRSERA